MTEPASQRAEAGKWGDIPDLNRRPLEPQSSALPTELMPPFLARPARLELTTYGLEGRCSIRLSYGRLFVLALP